MFSFSDPVEVLAVIEAVKEHSPLYYLVLGGSVVNDGVAFSLFEAFKPFTRFTAEEIQSKFDVTTLGYLGGSLLLDPLVGGLLGWASAHLASIIVKYIDNQPKLNYLKPLIILLWAGLAFLLSHLFGFSAIICLIVYGVTAERLTSQSNEVHSTVTVTEGAPVLVTISHIMRGLAATLHILLFFYLGFQSSVLINNIEKIWKFSLSVLVLMTVSRLIVTPVSCYLLNLLNVHGLTNYSITWKWQLLIFFGGMRGAVSFCMANDLDQQSEQIRDSTVFIILVTTLINGIIVKLLPRMLDFVETGTELIRIPTSEVEETRTEQTANNTNQQIPEISSVVK